VRKTAVKYLVITLFMLAGLSSTVFAQPFSVIIETTPGADIHAIAAALRGTVLDSMGGNVHLLSVPAIPSIYPTGIKYIESDSVQVSPQADGAVFTVSPTTAAGFYGDQPALQHVNLPRALPHATGRGVVIADINALVDVAHPALLGHLTTGAEFLHGTCTNRPDLNQSAGGFLDQSAGGFLDQSAGGFLDQSAGGFLDASLDPTAAFLSQSRASFLDPLTASSMDRTSPAHGHGTMVAGILAVMAPDAMIMPLRAFDDHGCGTTYNISKAIKYAVSHGAQVINMSFGISGQPQTLKNSIEEAVKAGVTVVASAGNENTAVPQYPAAFPGVLGVAATDLADVKTSFSNYGPRIFVSAPGANIISAYPGGYYAASSGTSFSAPMVAAEAALVRSIKTSGWTRSIAAGVDNIDAVNPNYTGELGTGRINLLKAVQ
jgi:hypothetical protein